MRFIKHHKFMKKKEEIAYGLTVLRREGDLDRLAHWRSGTLIDGGIVDHHGVVDPHGMEGSRQGVLVCGGGWRGEGKDWRRRRVGGAEGGERQWKRRAKEEKMGTKSAFSSGLSHVPHNCITDT